MGSLIQAGTEQGSALPATGGDTPCPAPAPALQPLHPQDPLLLKWGLKAELPLPSSTTQQAEAGAGAAAGSGYLRLCARLSAEQNEELEYCIPFSLLARKGGIVLGRCPQKSDIMLPHESISRRHALLEIGENGLVVSDLSSTNGTHVNERQLTPFERRVPLFHGASLQLGAARLKLEYIL